MYARRGWEQYSGASKSNRPFVIAFEQSQVVMVRGDVGGTSVKAMKDGRVRRMCGRISVG